MIQNISKDDGTNNIITNFYSSRSVNVITVTRNEESPTIVIHCCKATVLYVVLACSITYMGIHLHIMCKNVDFFYNIFMQNTRIKRISSHAIATGHSINSCTDSKLEDI